MEDNALKKGWSYSLLSQCRGELMGLALLWIMLFHTYALAPIPVAPIEWLKSVGFAGVDVFIFLSALGLSLSLQRREQTMGDYLSRRFVRILPTYWLVVGTYGLILRCVGRTSLRTVLWNLSTLFYWFHIPNTFNWYVPALLVFYLLAPACLKALKACPFPEVLTAAVYCLVLPLSTCLGLWGYGYVNDFVYRLPVFFLGLLSGLYIARGRALTGKALLGWLLLALFSPLPGRFFPQVGIYFSPVLTFTLVCMALCLAAAKALSLVGEGNPLRRFLRLLGESSLEIYLFNVIFVLEYGFFSSFLDIGRGRLFYYAVTTLLDMGLGVLLHRLLAPMTAALLKRIKEQQSPGL